MFFSIKAFIMEVYTELSVGWTRICSLDSVFTKYLSGAMTLSKSISGFILATPDMNIGGVYCHRALQKLLLGLPP